MKHSAAPHWWAKARKVLNNVESIPLAFAHPTKRSPRRHLPVLANECTQPRMRDLAIENVEMPSSVFVGQTFSARVTVRDENIDPSQITGDVTLGVAGIDLIYLRLSTLLCGADRVLPSGPPRKRRSRMRPSIGYRDR